MSGVGTKSGPEAPEKAARLIWLRIIENFVRTSRRCSPAGLRPELLPRDIAKAEHAEDPLLSLSLLLPWSLRSRDG